MANSVQKDIQGPDWPLGLIVVATPGTPVGIMSLVDPSGLNNPATPTPGTPGAGEYSVRANRIVFQGFKGNAGTGLTNNTGNVYVVRKGVGSGTGNRADYGSIVAVVTPGATVEFIPSAKIKDAFGPYRYSIDADNASDAALVTLFIF